MKEGEGRLPKEFTKIEQKTVKEGRRRRTKRDCGGLKKGSNGKSQIWKLRGPCWENV